MFVLASSSLRRLALLNDIGIAPDKVIASNINETPRAKELPRALASRLALEKLRHVMEEEMDSYVLAADTVVAVGRRILPKAESAFDVRTCLMLLSGRRHHVYTGVALRAPSGNIIQCVVDSVVAFHVMSSRDIVGYVSSGEGEGKAGGYAIQGKAACYIRFISGSYSNIVGLPLFEVAQMLGGSGYKW